MQKDYPGDRLRSITNLKEYTKSEEKDLVGETQSISRLAPTCKVSRNVKCTKKRGGERCLSAQERGTQSVRDRTRRTPASGGGGEIGGMRRTGEAHGKRPPRHREDLARDR